jgi:acetyl/propionyl-CoA carboxylase alpha subunit
VVWAADRPAAIERLRRALQEYQVGGIATTLTLFRALVDMPEFRAGELHTGFLDQLLASRRLDELHRQQDPDAEEAAIVAAACLATLTAHQRSPDPWAHGGGQGWWEEGLRLAQGRFPR